MSLRQRPAETGGGRELPALLLALLTAAVLVGLIYAGSRGLKDFDSALVGYAVGTVIAISGLVYRYTLWITRPPTWRYFRGGWAGFFSMQNFRRYTWLVPKALWTDIFAQTFLFRRSFTRWVMHMCIFWGVLLSLAITLPLTFGWLRFTYVDPLDYQLWVFGIKVMKFPLETVLSWVIFHALNFTAVLLLIGVGIAFWRRTRDAGLLVTQRLGFDLMPLIMLFAIAVTGLALTGSTLFWEGRYFWFISLVHQVTVVVWLISLPFGKFFHIIERPATIGVTVYQQVNADLARKDPAAGRCAGCGTALPSPQFITDLKGTLGELGQHYAMGEGGAELHDYCPSCKRKLRGKAYYQMAGSRFV